MRHLRGPSVPAVLLAFLVGVGLLLPEVSHSLAHHHSAEHHGASQSAAHHHGFSGIGLIGERHGGDHPHLDLLAAASAKTSLAHAAMVQVFVLLLPARDELRPLPLATVPGPPLEGRDHGPPPPSRAPPLI